MVNNHGDGYSPLRIGLWDPFQMAELHGLYMVLTSKLFGIATSQHGACGLLNLVLTFHAQTPMTRSTTTPIWFTRSRCSNMLATSPEKKMVDFSKSTLFQVSPSKRITLNIQPQLSQIADIAPWFSMFFSSLAFTIPQTVGNRTPPQFYMKPYDN